MKTYRLWTAGFRTGCALTMALCGASLPAFADDPTFIFDAVSPEKAVKQPRIIRSGDTVLVYVKRPNSFRHNYEPAINAISTRQEVTKDNLTKAIEVASSAESLFSFLALGLKERPEPFRMPPPDPGKLFICSDSKWIDSAYQNYYNAVKCYWEFTQEIQNLNRYGTLSKEIHAAISGGSTNAGIRMEATKKVLEFYACYQAVLAEYKCCIGKINAPLEDQPPIPTGPSPIAIATDKLKREPLRPCLDNLHSDLNEEDYDNVSLDTLHKLASAMPEMIVHIQFCSETLFREFKKAYGNWLGSYAYAIAYSKKNKRVSPTVNVDGNLKDVASDEDLTEFEEKRTGYYMSRTIFEQSAYYKAAAGLFSKAQLTTVTQDGAQELYESRKQGLERLAPVIKSASELYSTLLDTKAYPGQIVVRKQRPQGDVLQVKINVSDRELPPFPTESNDKKTAATSAENPAEIRTFTVRSSGNSLRPSLCRPTRQKTLTNAGTLQPALLQNQTRNLTSLCLTRRTTPGLALFGSTPDQPASPQTPAPLENPVEVPITGRWVREIGIGYGWTSLSKRTFSVVPVQTATGTQNIVSEATSEDVQPVVTVHSLYTLSQDVALGFTIGTTVPTTGATQRYLLGGSIELGRSFRFILSGGLAFGSRSRLVNDVVGQPILGGGTEPKSESRFSVGGFGSLSFAFRF